jgi:YidC/Oxa1 family membrane protein insertase
MADKKRSSRLWDFLVILAVVFLGSQYLMPLIFPQEEAVNEITVRLEMKDRTVTIGAAPEVVITNPALSAENVGIGARVREYGCKALSFVSGSDCSTFAYRGEGTAIALPDRCPAPPFDVFVIAEDGTRRVHSGSGTVTSCEALKPVAPGLTTTISLAPWKNSLFSETGSYELELRTGTGAPLTASFTIDDPGFIAKTFRAFITKPLLNALIFIASVIPGHDLGLAIILLTLAVKLALFIPTQHALEGQKKMQLLQPKFEAVRREYKDNPTKMQEETMKIWKEHKINPFQSCLPLLVQFPVLIGLFYVVQDGVHLDLSRHLIYPIYQNLSWTFDTHFLGLDLTKPYVWIFPPLLVVLQYLQIKLSLVIADKKKAKQIAATTTPEADTPQEMQQKMMLYVLPLVIGFFSLSYASALSIYWGFSTLFAIGQQLLVNREHIRP